MPHSVQVTYALRNGSAIKLTVGHWYLPDGRSINGAGPAPNVNVDLVEQSISFDFAPLACGYASATQLIEALVILGR